MLTEEEDVKIHVLAKRTWSISEIAGYRAYFTTRQPTSPPAANAPPSKDAGRPPCGSSQDPLF